MLTEQLRVAIGTAPYDKLPELAALLWRAFGEGRLSEADTEDLSAVIDARKRPSGLAVPAPKRLSGARPRTPDSLARRRKLASAGYLPPHLAASFTEAERAVLAIIAAEVLKRRSCTLSRGEMAARAGVSETVVKTATRQAATLGLLTREERRISKTRNDTTILRVVSPEWNSWLDRRGGATAAALEPRRATMAARGGGGRQAPGTSTFTYLIDKKGVFEGVGVDGGRKNGCLQRWGKRELR